MNSGEILDQDEEEGSESDSEIVEVVDKPTANTGDIHQPSDLMDHADSADELEGDDDSSAVTQDAGTNNLVQ
jgi:hypothetical protein